MKRFVLLVVAVLFASGCASANKRLSQEVIDQTNTIAVSVRPAKEDAQIFDHSKHEFRTYGGIMFGAVGGLIEGIIVDAQNRGRAKTSLGGDMEDLQAAIAGYDLESILSEVIRQRLAQRYEIVMLPDSMDPEPGRADESDDLTERIRYSADVGADLYMDIAYLYGLAAYYPDPGSLVILADLAIYDAGSEDVLLERRLSTDEYLRHGYLIPELIENDAKGFHKSMPEINTVFGYAVASHFDLDKELLAQVTERSVAEIEAEEISLISTTCQKPYRLTQDCSIWIGATRKIAVGGIEARVGASEDGRIILIMDFVIAQRGEAALRRILKSMTEMFKDNGVKIITLKKITNVGTLSGYLLELDQNGYDLVKPLTVE